MRKVAAILFHILAGFFVYMVSLLAFIKQPGLAKWAMVVGFRRCLRNKPMLREWETMLGQGA